MKIRNFNFFSNKKEASTAKVAVWYVFSNLFVSGIGFLTTPIFTRLLSKSEIGIFSNFTTWESILVIIASLNLVTSIARAKYDFPQEMDPFLFSILVLSNLVTLLCYVSAEMFPAFFSDLFSMDMKYVRLLFLYVMFWPAFQFLQAKHRVYQRYKICVAISIASVAASIGCSLLLVYLMDDKILGRTLGHVIPVVAMNLAIWIAIAFRGKRIRFRYMRYGCMLSVPLIIHALAGRALTFSDRIMIAHIRSNEEVALYVIPYTVSSIASIIWVAMNQAWTPWLFDRMAANEEKQVASKSNFYLIVVSVMIVGVLLVAPEVLLIMGGRPYEEAIGTMPPVILSCAYQFIYSMYANIEFFTKHTLQISLATMAAALFNIITNAFFIPIYGYYAAAYTTAASYLLLLLLHYIMVRIRGQYTKLYDNRFILMLTIILTMIAIACNPLYRNNLIRWSVLGIYVIVVSILAFRSRKRLIGMFK